MDLQKAVDRFRDRIGSDAYEALLGRLDQANEHIATQGILDFEGRKLLTGYSYGEFYDWDLYFESIYLSYYGVSRFCRVNTEAFLGRQMLNGFVSRTLLDPREHQHFKPFLAQLAVLHARQTQEASWPDEATFDQLAKYVDHWLWYCDLDKNGLCVWDSADHSGMDNQMSRAGAFGSWTVEGVDLNCYLVRELQAMAVLARRLGQSDAARQYERRSEQMWRTIDSVLWDDRDGFYYDRNERTGAPVRVKSVAGLLPLWLDAIPPDKAARLVDDHLRNEQEFWLAYPVASWSRQEPDYDQGADDWGCNWRGTTWIPANYMLMHGLLRHGYEPLARDLAYRTFEMALLRNDVTREYYNAETGEGKGLNPFWGWSCLAYFMPLECEIAYDPMALTDEPAVPLARALGVTFPAV
ncbi:MAG: hypothetical protein KGY99_07380 [Phycisphaerae bacterium]|nr:hypothetical protein [Phycisphaerae bacterium]